MVQPSIRPQPMLSVRDVERSSAWYQRLLGLVSNHGGPEYEQLLCDGELVLQLHLLEEGHHHGTIGDPSGALGNGVALWLEVDDFDAHAARAHELGVTIQADVHLNPNAGHRELWLRDLDGYLVVLADPYDRLVWDTPV